ncbi:TIGR00282 family metallophosphoesterase [Desulfurella sp.]|uniref:TIGR00282 family metallophosphoesterase n=1 Tax=Desulfurella sp. TaxID=1962857 RepID=UPI003D0ED86B
MQTDKVRVLFVGDIVGDAGRKIVIDSLDYLKNNYFYDISIANIENIAGGFGITKETYDYIEPYFDAFTTGNHVWDKKDIVINIDNMPKLAKPFNMPNTKGKSFVIIEKNNVKILIATFLGRIFMNPVDNPFILINQITQNPELPAIKVIDFHAEATSEKQAFGWYCDGKVSACLGTHTHVQTNDEKILPNGTAYITDVGLTGCHSGVIGFRKDAIIDKFITYMPTRFDVCKEDLRLNACIIDVNIYNGKAVNIEKINISST